MIYRESTFWIALATVSGDFVPSPNGWRDLSELVSGFFASESGGQHCVAIAGYSYDPAATRRAMSKIADAPVPYKISHLIARLCFRGIYFPQKGSLAWFKVMIENRGVILRIILDSFTKWRGSAEAEVLLDFDTGARKLAKLNLHQ
jgi:hypothetical protein